MSLAGWMKRRRLGGGSGLKPVNLVIETNFSGTRCEASASSAPRSVTCEVAAYRRRTHQEISGLALAILVGHASLTYDHGAYWDSFWQGWASDAKLSSNKRPQGVVGLLDKVRVGSLPRRRR